MPYTEPNPIFCPKTFVTQANLKCYWPKSKLIEYAVTLPGNNNHAHPQRPEHQDANPIFSLETVQPYYR